MTAALLVVILVFSYQANAVSARSAIMIDCVTGRVLYDKQSDKQSLIASTTKIMTALVVCEQCNVLDSVRVPKEAVGIEGSSMYLREGEILTVQDLLYGMMLHSGNDAAVALAIYCGGTVEGFVQMMNDKARSLGLTDTHFANPNGLDAPQHYSTAKDLGVLAAYAMKNPIFSATVSIKTVSVGNRYLKNHNKLLWQVEGADGVKTGYTRAAGRILVSSASRNGRRMVVVTINDPDDWKDHADLIELGFSQYSVRSIVEKGECLGEIEIAGGSSWSVQLIAAEPFSYSLSQDESICIVLPDPGFVYAPVAAGQDAGFARVSLDDHLVGVVPLVYGQTIEQDKQQAPGFWKRLFGGKDK